MLPWESRQRRASVVQICSHVCDDTEEEKKEAMKIVLRTAPENLEKESCTFHYAEEMLPMTFAGEGTCGIEAN
jgi:hypothetical protein